MVGKNIVATNSSARRPSRASINRVKRHLIHLRRGHNQDGGRPDTKLILKGIRRHISELIEQIATQLRFLVYVGVAYATLELIRVLHDLFSRVVAAMVK